MAGSTAPRELARLDGGGAATGQWVLVGAASRGSSCPHDGQNFEFAATWAWQAGQYTRWTVLRAQWGEQAIVAQNSVHDAQASVKSGERARLLRPRERVIGRSRGCRAATLGGTGIVMCWGQRQILRPRMYQTSASEMSTA